MRPSVQSLIGVVDQSDPAFMFIAAELQRIRREGGEFDSETIAEAIKEGRGKHARHLQNEADRQPSRFPESIVYYAQRGSLVKIGYTSQPHKRFGNLIPDAVLAWEPGGRPEEAARHEEFKALRISRGAEYFHRDEILDAHIEAVRSAHGSPDPSWPTLANLAQKPGRLRLPDVPMTPHLVTLEAGTRALGIRLGTAHVWVHRGKLHHLLKDSSGTKLYLLADLKSLTEKRRNVA
ncbi:hypothetical protein B0675_39905 [Streptomyces sp. M41(2017)]|nr:hypothetical protein B0675_39905 [Streptomyces sp. M41(2017)]